MSAYFCHKHRPPQLGKCNHISSAADAQCVGCPHQRKAPAPTTLVCDKLNELERGMKGHQLPGALLPLVAEIRKDCERMEAKLVARKAEALLRDAI